MIRLRYLQGRNANGAHPDAGIKVHALIGPYNALCGTKPGRLSGGWSEPQRDANVSCPRCAKRLAKTSDLYKCSGCANLISKGQWCEDCHKRAVIGIARAMRNIGESFIEQPAGLELTPPAEGTFLRILWDAANG